MLLALFFLLFFVALVGINTLPFSAWKKAFLGILIFFIVDFGLGWIAYLTKAQPYELPAFQLSDEIKPTALNPCMSTFNGEFGEHNNTYTRETNLDELFANPSILICCYGGSSTYCINLDERQSWPSQLEVQLREAGYTVEVHNHGIPGHSFGDNLHNLPYYKCGTQNYQQVIDIHYQGWNDFRMINPPYTAANQLAIQQWHEKTNRLVTKLGPIQPESIAYNYYYMNLISETTAHRIDFLEQHTVFVSTLMMKWHTFNHDRIINRDIQEKALQVGDPKNPMEELVMNNIHKNLQSLLGSEKSFVFIPQVMNFALIQEKKESFKFWMPGITEQKAVEYCRQLSAYCTENLPTKNYIPLEMERWRQEDFLDSGHFSEQGCTAFAQMVVEHLVQNEIIELPKTE